jgi:hypothetical protein
MWRIGGAATSPSAPGRRCSTSSPQRRPLPTPKGKRLWASSSRPDVAEYKAGNAKRWRALTLSRAGSVAHRRFSLFCCRRLPIYSSRTNAALEQSVLHGVDAVGSSKLRNMLLVLRTSVGTATDITDRDEGPRRFRWRRTTNTLFLLKRRRPCCASAGSARTGRGRVASSPRKSSTCRAARSCSGCITTRQGTMANGGPRRASSP